MKNIILILFIILLVGCIDHIEETTIQYLNPYNIEWNNQSTNPSESMPLGGGDVGANVWVEKGEILLYVSQSGTFDENNQMLKEGRFRIKLTPNPFDRGDYFQQKLNLEDGNIIIKGKKDAHEVTINLWVDVKNPVLYIETGSSEPVDIKASYESWRTEDVEVPNGMRHASFSYTSYPGKVTTYRDSISAKNNKVLWMHRNRNDKLLYDFCIKQQGLESVKDKVVNTQEGRTFGGILVGDGMVNDGISTGKYVSTNYTGWHLKTKKKTKSNTIKIVLHTNICDSSAQWEKELTNVYSQTKSDIKEIKAKTKLWWKEYWNRSFICLNSHDPNTKDPVWQVGRNYQLFRYMLGCNAYGDYPTKFNGSLFTVDPIFVRNKDYDWTPDFRCWGGGSFTAQNQRLVYWPMLKSGDFDMMPSQFKYYERTLSSAEARTETYWGHDGACFTEQLENFGLPFAGGWGFESGARKRDPDTEFGVQENPYVNYHYVNQLEFSLMMLDYYHFSGRDISSYMPFIKSSIQFFDDHYQYRQNKRTGKPLDENGKLVFYPSTAAEMYKMAKNPTDLIAALKTVVSRIKELPSIYISDSEQRYYKSLLKRIPSLSYDTKEGHRVIKPAQEWEYVANKEIPELYTVFPYGIYGLLKPDLDVAVDTYFYGESNEKRSFKDCWSQVGIFAARLGLLEEAAHLVVHKLEDSSRKFPAFWGPGPDWVPDVDHGGAGMINLQEMLLQTEGDVIHLLPTWPENWDVKFKLHAPKNTTIECEVLNGTITSLNITPQDRINDIHIDSKNIDFSIIKK